MNINQSKCCEVSRQVLGTDPDIVRIVERFEEVYDLRYADELLNRFRPDLHALEKACVFLADQLEELDVQKELPKFSPFACLQSLHRQMTGYQKLSMAQILNEFPLVPQKILMDSFDYHNRLLIPAAHVLKNNLIEGPPPTFHGKQIQLEQDGHSIQQKNENKQRRQIQKGIQIQQSGGGAVGQQSQIQKVGSSNNLQRRKSVVQPKPERRKSIFKPQQDKQSSDNDSDDEDYKQIKYRIKGNDDTNENLRNVLNKGLTGSEALKELKKQMNSNQESGLDWSINKQGQVNKKQRRSSLMRSSNQQVKDNNTIDDKVDIDQLLEQDQDQQVTVEDILIPVT
ncbi:MAG: hypothetical protein EZS28_045722, partial [Streblomastix strix]